MKEFLKSTTESLSVAENDSSRKFEKFIDYFYINIKEALEVKNDFHFKINNFLNLNIANKDDINDLYYYLSNNKEISLLKYFEKNLSVELREVRLISEKILKRIDFKLNDVEFIFNDLQKIEEDFFKSESYLNLNKIIEGKFILGKKICMEIDKGTDLKDLKSMILNNYKSEFRLPYKELIENVLKDTYIADSKFLNKTDILFNIVTNSGGFMNNMAQQHYLYSVKDKDKDKDKNMEEFINSYIYADEKYNIRALMGFEDKTFIVESKLNVFIEINTKKQRLSFRNDIYSKYLRDKYNKNPSICKDFIDIVKSFNFINTYPLISVFEEYFKNIEIFKNYDLNINSMKNYHMLKPDYVAEKFYDKMSDVLIDQKIKKTIKNMTSSKNIDLFNQESFSLVKDIVLQKIKIDLLESNIGRKIQKYKNTEELNEGLRKFLSSFGNTYDGILNKALNYNTKVVSKKNNTVILHIDNFKESSYLGSASWCISSNENYFNSYVNKEYGHKQYFIYDFNKKSEDGLSMIGITLSKEGDILNAHEKDDTEIMSDIKRFKQILSEINKFNNKKRSISIKI